ncbi:MAG: putative DNA binding domain-containing protein [Bacilli bacterium]|nr:putative DNA binding domain-containing protein [Bacilli bacterium]
MKLENCFETENQEFKSSLAELDKGILGLSSMLNKGGKGKVYFGVSDDGEIKGLAGSIGQETIKKIGNRVFELIKPVVIPKVYFETYGDLTVIVLEAEGYNRPYSCGGEYRIRVGSENKKMDPSIITEMVLSNSSAQMENLEALNQDLTFEQLKGLFRSHKYTVNDKTFAINAGLLTKKKTFNYLADILSDENNCSIKVVRFKGKDKQEMISRNEFGYHCLLLSMKSAFDYVASLNEVRVDLSKGLERKEHPLFDIQCFDEAWTNACLHNKWIKNIPPAIYIFDDRIEIVSIGGLPFDYSEEEFFSGISHPVNVGLQKIMGQLDMVEQTGHGVPKIVAVYGRKAFEIADGHITVTIPFAYTPSFQQISTQGLTTSQKKVLEAIKNNPTASIHELSQIVELGTTRISVVIKELKALNRLERIGKTKGGYWQVR